MQRHLFPGGITANGYHGFYADAIDINKLNKLIIIKGGPGVGKSTFMKSIARILEEADLMVEHLHCANDPNSLDGIVAPELGFAMVDGTSPHVIDPVIPGATDSILNLGVCLDEAEMENQKKAIQTMLARINSHNQRAYRYLSAAKSLRDDVSAIVEEATDAEGLNTITREMIESLHLSYEPGGERGEVRRLFATAVTPLGVVSYLSSLGAEQMFVLNAHWAARTEILLERVMQALVENGENVEAFFCPMDPGRLEHLFIPKRKLLITTLNAYHENYQQNGILFDINKYIDSRKLELCDDVLELDRRLFSELLDNALLSIASAKREHDRLEDVYIKNMDYVLLEQIHELIVEQCLVMILLHHHGEE